MGVRALRCGVTLFWRIEVAHVGVAGVGAQSLRLLLRLPGLPLLLAIKPDVTKAQAPSSNGRPGDEAR